MDCYGIPQRQVDQNLAITRSRLCARDTDFIVLAGAVGWTGRSATTAWNERGWCVNC